MNPSRDSVEQELGHSILRAIGESIDYGVWVCDAAGRNLYVSDSFLKLVGLTQEECEDFNWGEVLHPDDREGTMEAWRKCSAEGGFWEREHRFKGVDGRWHPVLARGVPIRNDRGEIIRWVGINLDVSAYRGAEAALSERTRTLEIINRLGFTVGGELNVQTVVQAVTDAAREIVGAAFGAFFYNRVNERGESYVLYTLSGAPREAFEKFGMPRNTPLFGPTFRGEGVVRIADVLKDPRYGQMAPHHGMPKGHLPVRSYLAAPVLSRSGEVLGGLFFGHPEPGVFGEDAELLLSGIAAQAAIAMDNAALHEAAKQDAERLHIAMAASLLGDWSWDAKTDLVTFSEAAAGLFDIPAGPHMTWTAMQELLHPEDRERTRAAVDEAVQGHTDYHSEYRVRRRRGGEFWVSAWGRATYAEDGSAIGMLGVVQNITERKRTEEALREAKEVAEAANRSKDHFLAVLSHELRTPLTPVLMAAAAHEANPELPEALRKDIAMIRRNVELETKIIDDLLDLSRITSGKLKLRPERVNLNEVVRQATEICLPQIHEKALKLRCDYDAEEPAVVADPSRLQQALWNLLKNAIKFTPEGGEIAVETRREAGRLAVRVRDTGKGMPAEIVPLIFDAFEQGGEKVTQQFGGLGLGLAISRALVELHQGTIRAESSGTGLGSVFTVELPEAPEELSCAVPPRKTDAPSTGPCHVLLAEDHADTAMMLERLLGMAGFTVRTAGTIAAARELAGREKFDLLVSDIGLPDGTGYELMRELKKKFGMRGIAMSGYGMEEDIVKSMEAGFSEHLVKPVNPTLLAQVIRQVAARWEA